MLGKDTDDENVFGVIHNIYVVQSRLLMEVQMLKMLCFDAHCHAFIVQENAALQKVLIWNFELYDFHVYGLYREPVVDTNFDINSCRYIVMKYTLC